jgi:hypothetical protein
MTQPETAALPYDGPETPDEDATFGPEPDDPRAASPYGVPYEVTEYDPANEQMDICEFDEHNGHGNGGTA